MMPRPFLVHRVQHAVGNGYGHRIGPVERIDIPHDRFQVRLASGLQAFLVARAIRKAKQGRALRVDRFQQCIGIEYFRIQGIPGLLRQLRMVKL